MMAQLSERDRGLLQNKIDDLNKSNQQLQDSITSDQKVVNNLILLDISSKKFTDEKHLEIYSLEEERRLLTGKTIIVPVQEPAFQVTTTEPNVKITINDGRFVAKKNDITFVDVPIIPSRAYTLSNTSGPDFEIWTRDRRGSTTSEKNVPASYDLHSGNNKLTVNIDGTIADIKIFEDILVDQQILTVEPFVLSAKITESMSAIFTNSLCIYNQVIQTFTIVSGTGGATSTAQVITSAVPTDLANLMKFTNNQVMVAGKYANNNLKINIDGNEQSLQLTFDIRIPVQSSLGLAIDDYSSDWRQSYSTGLLPAQPNNGPKIALLIQSTLRAVNAGGYTTAECQYYSDSGKFIIYSGTFGNKSSVQILPADDANRDFRFQIGMDQPTDSKENETSYDTLNDLYNYLNQSTCLQCSSLSNPTFSCYSLLSMNNALISGIQLMLQTTSMYDRASLSQPNLYGNKIRISSQVNAFNISDGATNAVFLPDGDYSESELASALQDLLNANTTSSNEYVVQYKQKPLYRFIISAKNNVQLLFNSGANKSTSIATFMGFANFSDSAVAKTFISNSISFAGVDFFSMALIPQFVPYAYLNFQPPYYVDSVLTETIALSEESSVLSLEGAAVTALRIQTSIDNDARLNNWINVANVELFVKNAVLQVIGSQMSLRAAAYGIADSVYTDMLAEYNSLMTDYNDVLLLLPNKAMMHLRQETETISKTVFGEGQTTQVTVYATSTGHNDRVYDRPAVEFRYSDNKFLAVRNMTSTYGSSVNYKLQEKIGFTLRTNMVTFTTPDLIVHAVTNVKVTITPTQLFTTVYWSGGQANDLQLLFSSYPHISDLIAAVTAAYSTSLLNEIWSRYSEKYTLFNGDQFSMQVGTYVLQTITVSCTNGSSISDTSPAEFAASGDTIILTISGESAKTITFPWATYNGADTAAMIQNLVRLLVANSVENQPAYTNFICTYSGTYNLYSGSAGTNSRVNIIGGTLQTPLKLGTVETVGTGPFTNNYFVTAVEAASILSFTGVTTTADLVPRFIKFTSTSTMQITSNDCATRLGFYTDNLSSAVNIELQSVASSSLQRIVNDSIYFFDRRLLRGYEYKDLTATYNVTDNINMNLRLSQIADRTSYIGTRQTQIVNRIPVIETDLSPTLYNERWTEVVNRLNKKTGSYYNVGQKELSIFNAQNTIVDNNNKITQIQTMLGS
jgi:hypothetical protein